MDLTGEFRQKSQVVAPSPFTAALTDDLSPRRLLSPKMAEFLKATDFILKPAQLKDLIPPTPLALGSNETPTQEQLDHFREAITGSNSAFALKSGNAFMPMPENSCIVVIPETGRVKSLFTLDQDNMPGTEADWDTWVSFHENAHCGDFKNGSLKESQAHNESAADYDASRAYYKAYREGLVSDPEVPYAARAMRSEHVMLYAESDAYVANAILPLHGESGPLGQYNSLNEAAEDILDAREKIYAEAGSDGTAPLGNLLFALSNRELIYETARLLNNRGAFNDNPAGRQFVENFVDGVQRYKGDLYGVQAEDIPKERPGIVDGLAQQFAPVARPALDPALKF